MRFMPLLFASVFDVFIGDMLFKWMGRRKVNDFKFLALSLLICALQILNIVILKHQAITTFVSMLIMFFLTQFYSMSFSLRLSGSITISLIMLLSELTVMVLTSLGLGVDIREIPSNYLIHAICVLLAKFTAFILVNFLVSRQNHIRRGMSRKLTLSMLVLPGSSLLVISLLYMYCYRISEEYLQVATFAASVLLAVANILAFHIINTQGDYISTKEQLKFAKANIESQKEYYKELYEYQREISQFRHDMKNFFTAILSKLRAGESEEVEKRIAEKLNFMDEFSRSIVNTGNPGLDSIWTSKLKQSEACGIKTNISIKLSSPIRIDELELGVLLGNALDNAIEAAVKAEGEKNINVSILTADETMLIKITNPVAKKVDVKNLETTKSDKKRHGYGLSGIRTIVQRNGGILDLECTDTLFTFIATLSNAENQI